MKPSEISAVILAAGYSSRMGFFKPLSELDGRAALEWAVRSMADAGIGDVVVVTGFRREETDICAAGAGARPVFNPRFSEGMFSSVQTGAASLSSSSRAFFLLPADIPTVRPATVRLLARYASFRGITYPLFQGKRGHPPLIGASFIPHILNYTGEGGLKRFLEMREKNSVDLAVADEGVLMDMDEPEDFERVRLRAERIHLPSPAERRVLFSIAGTPGEVIAHSAKVASVALRLAAVLPCGAGVDGCLLENACLLHDICRALPEHDEAGKVFLEVCGFPAVAAIASCHMGIPPRAASEAKLLYLADKLVRGTSPVSLAERKRSAMAEYGENRNAGANIRKRFARARRIVRWIEKESGKRIGDILGEDIHSLDGSH